MSRLLAPILAFLAATLVLAVPTSASAAGLPAPSDLDAYLTAKGSPMAGQGAAFVASGGRWQVDPRLLVAIAGAESSFGQITCAPFNAWGWGCPNGPYSFGSWADGIDTVTEGLRTGYLAEGRTTVALIHQKYAPVGAANDPTGLNSNWTINVSRFIVELGGDPNDLDMDGIAGSIPLGPLGGAGAADEFGFGDVAAPGDDEDAADDAPLEVASGTPRPLVVRVRNTGTATWSTGDVRLRRVDTEPDVVGAPYGALADAQPVAPGEEAIFSVQLAAAGIADGSVETRWRLEGPGGPFGAEIVRPVTIAVPAFVAGDSTVELEAANGGVVGGASAWTAIVHVRNAGTETWRRDGDDGVVLGFVASAGAGSWSAEGWINDRAVARMLEREAAPGEQASFAFRVRGDGVALALRPFRTSGWAAGAPAVLELGRVDPQLVAGLRADDR